VADHILVFHRGIGTARLKGLLIEEKLDLLTEYTVMRILDRVIALLPSFLWRRPAAAPPPAQSAGGRASSAASRRGAPSRCDSALGGEMQGEKYVASDHKYAKVGGAARVFAWGCACIGLLCSAARAACCVSVNAAPHPTACVACERWARKPAGHAACQHAAPAPPGRRSWSASR
jgi:hypothetical protein